ncbi:MAG: hypothetical protein K2X48_14105 [Chitinophagaceae bacterium]|nr:hypothetical protein [Chitinophagaceae bacterium]
MKKRILFASFILFIAASAFTTVQNWKYIGDKWAAFGPDRDVLHVGVRDEFRQIKIKVTDGPLHIADMDVYFDNGEKFNVELKNNFRAGQESRIIDLPGGLRKLDKIEFKYSTIGRARGRARVAVWGRR